MKASLVVCCIAAVLLFCGLLSFSAYSNARQDSSPRKDSVPSNALVVILSSDQNGHLTPCGCAKPMLGGLPRRASYIRSLPSNATLLKVENGDLTEALGRQDELKAETTLDVLNHLGYDAINLGEKDFRQGVPFLQALEHRFQGTLLCGNARKLDGSALFTEYTVVSRTVAGRLVRVVVIGLLSGQFAEPIQALNPDMRLELPEETLQRLRPEIVGQGEVYLLLYHGSKSEAVEMARTFPFLHLVVYAHQEDPAGETERVGSVTLACSGKDGKHIGQAQLTREGAKDGDWRVTAVKYVTLGPDFADDARVMQIKQSYLQRVNEEDLLSKVPRLPTANGDTFAGSAACRPCHAEAYRIWKGSAHAKAMQTLVNEKHDRDPECVPCHVVGLDRRGGFVSREKTPGLQDVGCESCHGAAARHVRNPNVKMPKAGSLSCNSCHVPEHSPRFDFATYWEKIKH